MLTSSPALILSWQIGVSEAISSHVQFVESSHVLIGLLRALDLLDSDKQQGFEKDTLVALQKDLAPLQDALSACGLDRVKLRRRIRGLAGEGEYEHPKDEAIHRSQNRKECFTRAEELARQLGAATVGALYFLAALLESENEIITKALASFKISVPDFKEIVGKAARGEAIPVQKKKEKKEAAPASFLAAYGIDLTALAREGKLEPMIGRREELNKSAEMLREAARSIGF